jgi:hypothetical protein
MSPAADFGVFFLSLFCCESRNKTSLLGSNINMFNWKIKRHAWKQGYKIEAFNSWDAPQGVITYITENDLAEIWVVTVQNKFLEVKVGFRSIVRASTPTRSKIATHSVWFNPFRSRRGQKICIAVRPARPVHLAVRPIRSTMTILTGYLF